MRAIFLDTETQGLPLFSEPSEHPRQPHIVQLAALLVDVETRKTLASLDLVINPVDWEIPDDVAKIHGITTEYARDVGVREEHAVELLIQLWKRADFRVAHNEQFDARIVKIALHRHFPSGYGCDPTSGRPAAPSARRPWQRRS
jgi:DNA polymerase-3 subunit epsilon